MNHTDALGQYVQAHTSVPSPLLQELEQETRRDFERHRMLVGAVEGRLLALLVRLSGARRVLEIGMFTGYSALTMAEALPEDGRLLTCDLDERPAAVARKYFARSPHGHKIEIRMGPALETLATLEGPFDLAFIDADKESYVAYYERTMELLRPGGLILADNAFRGGRVLAPEDASDHALVQFNARVQSDPRVENLLLPVRDGVMMAVKR